MNSKLLSLAIFSFIFLLFGCNSDKKKIDEFIRQAELFPTQIDSSYENNSEPKDVMEGTTRFSCYTKSGEERKTLEEFVTFNPTNGVLFPGSLIHGSTLKDGLLTNINIKQGGGTFTINNIILDDTAQKFNTAEIYSKFSGNINQNLYSSKNIAPEEKRYFKSDTFKYSQHIDEVTEAKVKQLTTELLSKLPNKNQVARIFFTKSEMSSVEKEFLKAGISIEWMKRKFSAEVSRLQESKMSKYLVKVVQPYYDISFKPDFKNTLNPSDFFNKSVKSKDVIQYFTNYNQTLGDKINPPTYVQSVTYGRMLIIVAESSEKQDILKKTMDLAFESRLVSGTSHLEQEQLNIIKNSTFTVFSIGGSADASVSILTAGKEGLADSLSNYLKMGANYSPSSPAFPISYVTRFLKNDDVSKLGLAFKFSVPICTPNPRLVKGIIVRFHITEDNKDDDESVSMTVIKNGSNRLIETPRYGYGQDWEENSPPISIFVPTTNLNETELDVTNVWIYKSPEHGGGSGYGGGMIFNLDLIAVLEDGTEIAWRSHAGIKMGDGETNYRPF